MRFYGKRPPIAAEYARYPVPLRRVRALSEGEAAAAYGVLTDPENVKAYGEPDKTYPSAVCFYRAPFLADMHEKIGELIRPFLDYDIVGTYWYARLYGLGDKLDIHVDRGACFVSVSVCFGYEYNGFFPEGATWELGALDESGGAAKEVLFGLKPGEGMLYPGCSAPHWRDVFLGERCGQAFFHYVPADEARFGEYFGDAKR